MRISSWRLQKCKHLRATSGRSRSSPDLRAGYYNNFHLNEACPWMRSVRSTERAMNQYQQSPLVKKRARRGKKVVCSVQRPSISEIRIKSFKMANTKSIHGVRSRRVPKDNYKIQDYTSTAYPKRYCKHSPAIGGDRLKPSPAISSSTSPRAMWLLFSNVLRWQELLSFIIFYLPKDQPELHFQTHFLDHSLDHPCIRWDTSWTWFQSRPL